MIDLQKIGSIKQIHRYPVKSFQGESLSFSKIEPYGLRGDRSHAFINHDRFNRHLSAKIIPYLLGYHATYTENVSTHNSPALKITSPQQETFHWDDGFLQHMTERFSLDLSMETLPMDYEGRTAVDEANLLLTTGSSLKALEKLTGDSLDMRRFRPNIVVSLDEEKPFEEKDWLGRALKIGDIEIEVYKECKRCIMIGVDPVNTSIDMSILRSVSQELDAHFGVYAKIIKTGSIQTDDSVYLI